VCACVRVCESVRVHACVRVCEIMHQAVLGRHIQVRDATMLWCVQVLGTGSNVIDPESAMFAQAKPQA